MTTWQLIRTMVQKGYQFEAGPHFENMRCYWSRFIPIELVATAPECDECGERCVPDAWEQAGHAMTLHRAVVMAAKIALGKPVVIPPTSEFEL